MSIRSHRRWLLAFLLTAVFWGLVVTTAAAATRGTTLELLLPLEGKVGEDLRLEARLASDDGFPVAGGELVFYRLAEFQNVRDRVELGRSVTDGRGAASWVYVPRSSGQQTIVARFAGNDAYASTETTVTVAIAPGPQLYHEEVGVDVPQGGVWFLAAVLGAVWGVYVLVVVLLGLIAGKAISTGAFRG